MPTMPPCPPDMPGAPTYDRPAQGVMLSPKLRDAMRAITDPNELAEQIYNEGSRLDASVETEADRAFLRQRRDCNAFWKRLITDAQFRQTFREGADEAEIIRRVEAAVAHLTLSEREAFFFREMKSARLIPMHEETIECYKRRFVW